MIPVLGLYDFSTIESERILRLPMYYGLIENDVELVYDSVKQFCKY